VEHGAPKDGPHLVQPVFERGDHAEIAATTAQTPEEIIVLSGAGSEQPAIGGNHVGGDQVATNEAVLTHQSAEASAQRETSDAGARDYAHGGGQAEGLRLAQHETGLGTHCAANQIYSNALHAREVDHQTAVGDRFPGDAMTTTAHGDQKVVFAAEANAYGDVGGTGAARDNRRTAGYPCVMNSAAVS
jgi:hypothetical protein